MRAITLHQPWAYAISHLGKRVENRDWSPPQWLLGRSLAIHAGKTVDAGGPEALREMGFELPPMIPVGAVVAVATVAYAARHRGEVQPGQAQWFVGPYGWVLRDVVALPEPVPARGFQRLWPLPPDALLAVERQWRAAVATSSEASR